MRSAATAASVVATCARSSSQEWLRITELGREREGQRHRRGRSGPGLLSGSRDWSCDTHAHSHLKRPPQPRTGPGRLRWEIRTGVAQREPRLELRHACPARTWSGRLSRGEIRTGVAQREPRLELRHACPTRTWSGRLSREPDSGDFVAPRRDATRTTLAGSQGRGLPTMEVSLRAERARIA
jgi:hypothetical protein